MTEKPFAGMVIRVNGREIGRVTEWNPSSISRATLEAIEEIPFMPHPAFIKPIEIEVERAYLYVPEVVTIETTLRYERRDRPLDDDDD